MSTIQVNINAEHNLETSIDGGHYHVTGQKIPYIFNPLSYGAKYDGVTDDSQAHEDMFADLPTVDTNRIIQLPAGTTRLSRALRISHACVIQGVGGGANDGSVRQSGTCLKFDDGAHGVIIESRYTSIPAVQHDNPGGVPVNYGAEWCVLKDVYITSTPPANGPRIPNRNGLTLRGRAHIENVIVDNFTGDGFHIVSADDCNVDDANRLWMPGQYYSDGDWVRFLGQERKVLKAKEILTLTPLGNQVIELQTNSSWHDTISPRDVLVIPENVPIAGIQSNPAVPLIANIIISAEDIDSRNTGTYYDNKVSVTPKVPVLPSDPLQPIYPVLGDYLYINGVSCIVVSMGSIDGVQVYYLSRSIPYEIYPDPQRPGKKLAQMQFALAYAANANAGMYIVGGQRGDGLEPPTSNKLQAAKISDLAYFVDSGTLRNPVKATHKIRLTAKAPEPQVFTGLAGPANLLKRFLCTKSGITDTTGKYLNYQKNPFYPNNNTLADGSVVWKEGDNLGNANNWFLQYCRTAGNGRHGFFVQGDEVNAGCAIQCDATANNGWGFFDNSFLGNTWIACHAATNFYGPYRTSSHGNCFSTFIGSYTEPDQSSSIIYPPSTVVGGLHSTGILGGSGSFISAHLDGQISFRSGKQRAVVTIGHPTGEYFMSLQHPKESTPLLMKMTGDAITMEYSNFSISTANSISPDNGRYPGRAKLVQEYIYLGRRCNYIGYNREANYWDANDPNDRGLNGPSRNGIDLADSSMGVLEKGDRIYKYDPQPGGYEGWVVTEAGTTGSLSEMNILANGAIVPLADGSNVVRLNTPVLNLLRAGRYLRINGTKARIVSIREDGLTITMSEPIPAPAAPKLPSIEYARPVFNTFGYISPVEYKPLADIPDNFPEPRIISLANVTYNTHLDKNAKIFQVFGVVKIVTGTTGAAFSILNPNPASGFSFCVLCTVQSSGSRLTSVTANTTKDPMDPLKIIVTISGNKNATIDTDVSWLLVCP